MGSAARPGGLAAPGLAAPPMFVYTIYCEATTHSALLETGIRKIKTGHRDVTFDQKTRFLNLSSIHTRTTRFPKSLQEGAWWVRIGWGGRQGVRGWSLGEQTRKLSKNQNLLNNQNHRPFFAELCSFHVLCRNSIFQKPGRPERELGASGFRFSRSVETREINLPF